MRIALAASTAITVGLLTAAMVSNRSAAPSHDNPAGSCSAGPCLPTVGVRPAATLPDEGAFPGFAGATAWVNSAPLSTEATRGKVVVVNFWTFACSNCLAALPHVKSLEASFRDRGVLVVGVHTPELSSERDEANVRNAIRRLGVVYPVAIDEGYRIWHAFNNEYWPAMYIVDAHGRIRYHHFGEGAYDEEQQVVDKLLKEASGTMAADYRP